MADLIFYLPEHLKQIRELRAIVQAETPAFTKLSMAQKQLLDDQFVMTASDSALKRYELMFGIPAGTGLPAEERRFQILAKLNNRLPYSMGWLRRKLDTLFGAGNYQITRDIRKRYLAVETDVQFESVLVALYDDLRASIPANMELETYISSQYMVEQYHACWMQTYDEIYL